MNTADRKFTGSIPKAYQEMMVPLIFESYAEDMAQRVAEQKPRDILEIAAGTGVLTRAMAARLGTQARITATDLNPDMLQLAEQTAPGEGVTFRVADALALPFEEQRFDAVVCQFGAMFFPDKVQGFREARRVLRRGGIFSFSVWDKISENEFTQVVEEALAKRFPDAPPTFMSRTPHGYANPDRIRADVKAAGYSDITLEPLDRTSSAPSAKFVAEAHCQGTILRSEIEARGNSLAAVTDYVAQELSRRFGNGPVSGRIRAFVIQARR